MYICIVVVVVECVLECVRVCTDRPVVGVVQSAHCVIFENRVVFCVCALSRVCVHNSNSRWKGNAAAAAAAALYMYI
jgi:hypothetical protein